MLVYLANVPNVSVWHVCPSVCDTWNYQKCDFYPYHFLLCPDITFSMKKCLEIILFYKFYLENFQTSVRDILEKLKKLFRGKKMLRILHAMLFRCVSISSFCYVTHSLTHSVTKIIQITRPSRSQPSNDQISNIIISVSNSVISLDLPGRFKRILISSTWTYILQMRICFTIL